MPLTTDTNEITANHNDSMHVRYTGSIKMEYRIIGYYLTTVDETIDVCV